MLIFAVVGLWTFPGIKCEIVSLITHFADTEEIMLQIFN